MANFKECPSVDLNIFGATVKPGSGKVLDTGTITVRLTAGNDMVLFFDDEVHVREFVSGLLAETGINLFVHA